MANDVNNPLQMDYSSQMALQITLRLIQVLPHSLTELLPTNLQQMITLLNLLIQRLLIIDQMLNFVRQVVNSRVVDREQGC